MRVFISINIPKEIASEIKKIQDTLPKFLGKKTELENLHLTLKFLGEVDENTLEKVKEKLKNIQGKKFKAEINKIGFFDNLKSRKYEQKIIVWLSLTNCENLQKQVDEKLRDLFEPEKRFMSHLTIARVKYVQNKKDFFNKLKQIKFSKIKFEIDHFYLMQSKLSSKASKYEILEEYFLV